MPERRRQNATADRASTARRVRSALSKKAYDRVHEGFAVGRIDDRANALVGNSIGTAATPSADHPETTSRRLEIDNAEAFLRAGHHIEVGQTIEIGQIGIGDIAEEANHTRRHLGSGSFQAGTVVAVTGHDMNEIRSTFRGEPARRRTPAHGPCSARSRPAGRPSAEWGQARVSDCSEMPGVAAPV